MKVMVVSEQNVVYDIPISQTRVQMLYI